MTDNTREEAEAEALEIKYLVIMFTARKVIHVKEVKTRCAVLDDFLSAARTERDVEMIECPSRSARRDKPSASANSDPLENANHTAADD